MYRIENSSPKFEISKVRSLKKCDKLMSCNRKFFALKFYNKRVGGLKMQVFSGRHLSTTSLLQTFTNLNFLIHFFQRLRRTLWISITISLILSQNSYKSFFNILPDAFYQAIQDILFMCFLGWSIIAFHCYKTGNIFRWFLSHPLWQPFAKLTLSTFLVHDIYIFMSVANTKTLQHYSFGLMMVMFVKDILISTLLGAILYLCVEIPAAKVSSYLLDNKKQNIADSRVDALNVHRC